MEGQCWWLLIVLVAAVAAVAAVGGSCGWGRVRTLALAQKRTPPARVTTSPVAPVVIFYHIAQMGDWENIVNEQVSLLRTSGLYEKADRIMVTALGSQPLTLPPKMEISHRSDNLKEYEIVTMNMILKFAKSCTTPHYILYIHTKGVTKRMCNGINGQYEWRQLMNYWNIERHTDMIGALDQGFMTAGINLMNNTNFHYSGNIWWASSSHIKTLAPIPSNSSRLDAELWVLSRRLPQKHISLYGPYVISAYCSGLYGNTIERKTYEGATQDIRIV